MRIYVECIPDEILIRFLLRNEIESGEMEIRHKNGKHWLAKQLRKKDNKNRNWIGLVDEDPHSDDNDSFHHLKYRKMDFDLKTSSENGNHYVVLCPKLEDWIISVAHNNELNLLDFGLPADGNELHKIINKNQDGYKRLLKGIGPDAPEFEFLRKLLTQYTHS